MKYIWWFHECFFWRNFDISIFWFYQQNFQGEGEDEDEDEDKNGSEDEDEGEFDFFCDLLFKRRAFLRELFDPFFVFTIVIIAKEYIFLFWYYLFSMYINTIT